MMTDDNITTDDGVPETITNVLDAIGIEVYKYLHPEELFRFSLASHHIYHEVSKGLIQACLRQMPQNFGSQDIDHCIKFNNRHSYTTKEKLLDHLLGKIRTAELKLVGTEDLSLDDSIERAKEALTNKLGAKFLSYNSDLPVHLRAEFTSVGHHYDVDNKPLATSRTRYILSRMEIINTSEKEEEEEGDNTNNNRNTLSSSQDQHYDATIVKRWIEYILSQNHIVAGTWFWSCRHRNLDFQGVEGKGVMISSPNAEGEKMEICWTRLTASRV